MALVAARGGAAQQGWKPQLAGMWCWTGMGVVGGREWQGYGGGKSVSWRGTGEDRVWWGNWSGLFCFFWWGCLPGGNILERKWRDCSVLSQIIINNRECGCQKKRKRELRRRERKEKERTREQ